MYRRLLSCLLTASFIGLLTSSPAYAGENIERQKATGETAREIIKSMGEGYRSRVAVKLQDRTKLEGYISTVSEDYFAITSEKTGKTEKVAYSEVVEIKRLKLRINSNRRPFGEMLAAVGIIVFAFAAYAISDRER
jgi:hypothetical protein